MTKENDTGDIKKMRNRIFFIFKEDLMYEFTILYVSKIRSVHTLERWTGGGNIRLRLFLLPIFPSSPILIMRVVWFDNLETVLTNKDPVLIFLDTNSKKSVLLKGTLMTWLHLSNLNPNSASDSSPLRKEGWWTSGGKSLWVHPFSLSSFFRSWMCFNISCSNSYWNS